jgi:hypothetical protein
MRTLVVTGCEEGMRNVLDLTIPSKQKWCRSYGYDFLVKRNWPEKLEYNFKSDTVHIGFLRVVACFEQLRYYDNVMWLDGDSIITNQQYKIEDFIDDEHCFFASYNWMVPESPSGQFTTGNFIIKRTPSTDIESLYNAFLQISQNFLNNICVELATFNLIYSNPNFYRMFKVLPHKYLNSCPEQLIKTQTWINDNNRTGIVAPWNEEAFLAHLTGCSTTERCELLETYFAKYL